MIVDFHTHIFPPGIVAERDRFLDPASRPWRADAGEWTDVLARDPTFAEMYGGQRPAKIETAKGLIASMHRSGADVSVALGFAWRQAEDCRRHNDYILESAAGSDGRLVPFCTVQPAAGERALATEIERCARAGARGLGELRPESQGWELCSEAGDALGHLAGEHGLVLLFHVSEPVGHAYAGKAGLGLDSFVRFAERWPDVRIVAAHWGGGLPFYTLMPEVGKALANVWFDTAGTSLLYSPEVYRVAADLVGADRVVFGSDFPLLAQSRSRQRVEDSGLDAGDVSKALGENARRLLSL